MIEELLKDIAGSLKRIADTNEGLLSLHKSPEAEPEVEVPPPAAPAPKATGKGKDKPAAAAKAAETPAPEPEAPKVDVEAECKALRAKFLLVTKKDVKAGNKLFADYKEEVGIPKIEDMSTEQRVALLQRFEDFLSEEAPEEM